MAKNDTVREPRRKLLQDSFHPETGGGFTIHAAKMMAEPLGGKPAECTLTAHCRTFVFDFPRAFLTASEAVAPNVLYNSGGLRASIVSDLPAFFENAPADSLHYSIDVSLPVGIRETYDNALKQHKGKDDRFFSHHRRLCRVCSDSLEYGPVFLDRRGSRWYACHSGRPGGEEDAGCLPRARLSVAGLPSEHEPGKCRFGGCQGRPECAWPCSSAFRLFHFRQ